MKVPFAVTSINYRNQQVTVVDPEDHIKRIINRHAKVGSWFLMAVIKKDNQMLAVFEDLENTAGSIIYVSKRGIELFLPKSAEVTTADEKQIYGGRPMDELLNTNRDILGEEMLAGQDDPSYERVAPYLPPLNIPTFIGTRHTTEKVVFAYGGRTDYIDFGRMIPEIEELRKQQKVLAGLVGGYLPVLRFLLPAGENRFWEEIVFAQEDPAQFWKQPIWYRLLLVENGQVKEAKYYFNTIPFPKLKPAQADNFYSDLLKVQQEWRKIFKPAMRIQVPEKRISDFCLHSLVLEMTNRLRGHPKYGYADGYKQHGCGWNIIDCVQPTFNSSVTAMLEWGMYDIARQYINDYYEKYVFDDGSLFTMGPEIPGYGRMLSNLAQYYLYTKDSKLILKFEQKIKAIIHVLFSLCEDARKVSSQEPDYGLLRGWVENDSIYGKDPYEYMLPYFSNSTEVWRGFNDLGQVFKEIGSKNRRPQLKSLGLKMVREAEKIEQDLHEAIKKSTKRDQYPPFLACFAGGKEPWQWLDGRVFSTMMSSGVLNKEEVEIVTKQQKRILSLFRGWSKGGKGMLGFDVHGYPYGLIQHDLVREFLLFYYADMAHIHSRGNWTALELANADGTQETPFCPPAQMTIPLNTKWMLVFEDPKEPVLWITRGTPREWLEDGEVVEVANAPTRWGKIGFKIESEISKGKIRGSIHLPPMDQKVSIKIKLRTPHQQKIEAVKLDGKEWNMFDPILELITIPVSAKKTITFEALY